jgi:multimeric flavodoxin WrbA
MTMDSAPLLLIIYHSQSGNTERLARAIEEGARSVSNVTTRRVRASLASEQDLKESRAVAFCSPEYFGYMAGAVKDFFDRTYEDVREHVTGKSYALVICAGNDGSGALSNIERIIAGLRMRRVQEPVVCRGDISEDMLEKCRELGHILAAGIELGIY